MPSTSTRAQRVEHHRAIRGAARDARAVVESTRRASSVFKRAPNVIQTAHRGGSFEVQIGIDRLLTVRAYDVTPAKATAARWGHSRERPGASGRRRSGVGAVGIWRRRRIRRVRVHRRRHQPRARHRPRVNHRAQRPRFTGHNKHCTRGSYMAPSPASRIYRGGRVPGNPFSRSNRSVS